MIEKELLKKLSVIAKLLAELVTKDLDTKEGSTWVLHRSGMSNTEIGEFLDISSKSVSAHITNRKNKIKKEREKQKGKKGKNG